MIVVRKSLQGLCLAMLVGCGTAEQGSEQFSAKPQTTQVELVQTDWKSTVTQQELESFKKIVDQLPLQEVPEFAKADLSNLTTPTKNIQKYIEHLRDSYRTAIDPQRQGNAWLEDSEIAETFSEIQVDPHDFAALATKISLAWSASAVKGEIPIRATQRRLKEQLEKLAFDVQHPSPTESEHERQQRVTVIQEIVALSEFLTLIQGVSDESLAVVETNAELLQRYLPQGSLQSRFEQHHESSPSVIRVGHTAK